MEVIKTILIMVIYIGGFMTLLGGIRTIRNLKLKIPIGSPLRILIIGFMLVFIIFIFLLIDDRIRILKY